VKKVWPISSPKMPDNDRIFFRSLASSNFLTFFTSSYSWVDLVLVLQTWPAA